MPDISSVGHGAIGPVDRLGSNARHDAAERPGAASPPVRPGDRVELSDHVRYLDDLRRLPDARTERVDEVRASIERGDYETDEKLDLAIGRLLEELGG